MPPDEASLSQLGWDDHWAVELARCSTPDLPVARVTRVDLGAVTALGTGGELRATVDRRLGVAVGDWITVGPGGAPHDLQRVAECLPRRTVFRRSADETGSEQVIAANIDTALLVNALDARVSLRRIERYLALAWQTGAVPVVVLSKADAVGPVELTDALDRVRGVALGVHVLAVSVASGAGLGDLDRYLEPGRTVALLGSSGAGKSTLVNHWAGEEVLATNAVRTDGKGRHTTTHRQLVPLPGRGLVIDTPGMRAIALWDADEGVDRVFADVDALAGTCRFSDCAHQTEPGCAVRAAVDNGELDAARVSSWEKLQRELRHLATRTDARLRAEEERRWKAISKAARQRAKP